jgi:hypothetical protein
MCRKAENNIGECVVKLRPRTPKSHLCSMCRWPSRIFLMYELKKIGKVFTSKFVGTGPSSYEKRIYRAAVLHRLRNPNLRRRSSAARPPRLWVRMQPGAWMFVCCECCVLSGRGLCDGLNTRPEESYRLWRVVVCDQGTSRKRGG